MKKLLIFLGALALQAQTVALSDTLTNAVGGGSYTGRITVTINSPASAQPLYYSTTSLTGWSAVYCLGVTGSDCTTTTSAGTFAATLYANSTITPAGTSYSARFTPSKGSPWSETWVVTPSTTTLRQVRSTTVPTPTVMLAASQITPGSSGQVLTTSGGAAVWAAASGVTSLTGTANQITASASTGAVTLSLPGTITGLTSVSSTGFTGALTGNASTATALAANPADCSAGQYATTIAASGDLTCAQVAYSQISGTPSLAAVATSGSASDLSAGTLAAARGGAGTVNGILKADGAGLVSAASAGTDYVVPAGNVATATALAANPTDCSAGQYANAIAANGNLTCAAVAYADVSGTPSLTGYAVKASNETITGNWLYQSATDTTLTVKAGASQAANLLEIQDSSGSPQIYFQLTPTQALFTVGSASAASRFTVNLDGSGNELISVDSDGEAYLPFAVRGTVLTWQGVTSSLFDTPTATFHDTTATTGDTKLVVKAGAGQAGNLFELQANDGTAGGYFTLQAFNGAGAVNLTDNVGGAVDFYVDYGGVMGLASPDGYFEMNSGGILSQTADRLANRPLAISASTVTIRDTTDTTGATLVDIVAGAAQTTKSVVLQTGGRITMPLTTPTTSSETCTAGTFAADASYVYVCTATDTWKRAALSAF